VSSLPTRILDVCPDSDLAMVSLVNGTGLEAAYVALSHCGGDVTSNTGDL
jgi:hypothetical protein